MSENDQLKKIKEQSYVIINNLNENVEMSHKQVREIEQRLQIATQQLPYGEVDSKIRKNRDRDNSQNKKFEFDLSQKQEALNFKDKSLKQASQDIKKLKDKLVILKKDISIYEEKNISLKSQINAKNDCIRNLESKVTALINTSSISIKLETDKISNEKLSAEENSMFHRNICNIINNIDSSLISRNHIKKDFESKSFNQDDKLTSCFRNKSKAKTVAHKLSGLSFD